MIHTSRATRQSSISTASRRYTARWNAAIGMRPTTAISAISVAVAVTPVTTRSAEITATTAYATARNFRTAS
jgi:hypothetical protein